ncbi:hypothetical protein [Abyssisolibacter fermentans]|uniref:hypothetical protein n=1 Tax=Abyssisolibacter fermentans TaxID=1766203 RepID=UPI00192E74D4|nr:hypothetical protein [Abyssisolibacter fermentans]
MNNILKIIFLDSSELAENEALDKGYRNDVYVVINNQIFHINIYDIVRLKQDFDSEQKDYNYYAVEPNLILVKKVDKENIIYTIRKLNEEKYFENIKKERNISINLLKQQYSSNIEIIL